MLIALTYHCSMGCTHCLSDCKPDGNHMPLTILKDALEFCDRNKIQSVNFSGGEMFEHPDIMAILDKVEVWILNRQKQNILTAPVAFITNGKVLAGNIEYLDRVQDMIAKVGKQHLLIQVTNDSRFYPTALSEKEKYRLRKVGAIIDTVPNNPDDPKKCLYPQGRALQNFADTAVWNTIGPKCGNLRLLTKQLPGISFEALTDLMTMSLGKFCTPVIAPNGDIKLGESALCPAVASIYYPNLVIMERIRHFSCKKCEIAFEKLKESKHMAYEMLSK